MSIWFGKRTLEEIQGWHPETMGGNLGIRFTEIGEDYLKAEMPVTARSVQPFRTLHGGASAALAETIGSVASQMTVDDQEKRCVGLSLNVSHIRPVPEGGIVYATARPFHTGRTTQVWDIQLTNEQEKPVAVARLTMMVLNTSGEVVPPSN